jgi:Ca2+-binding RTX toxin-like protein
MTLFLLAVPAAGRAVPQITESEPNETPGTADALPGGECFVVGSGALSPAGDEDFWSFPGSSGASAWAYVDTGGTQNPGATSTDSRLALLGTDGATTLEVDDNDGIGNGGDGTVEAPSASAIAGASVSSGTHFLQVMENGDDGAIDPYRLFLAVSTTSVPEAEPNNTSAETNAMAGCPEVRSGAISSGTDEDWYAVNAAAGDTIFVAAADTPGLVISLRSATAPAAVLISGPITNFPPPAGVAFSYNVSAAGTYLVRVRGPAGETGPYRLMVGHGPVAPGPGPGADRCAGRRADQVGTSRDDVLVGTPADETFVGLGGNDRITGRGGDDTICAGPGKDTVRGEGGKDRILGEGGKDTVKGGGGKDTLKGGSAGDRLAGQGGNDNLRGQGGRDRLNGGPGIDRCAQGGGTGPEISCER